MSEVIQSSPGMDALTVAMNAPVADKWAQPDIFKLNSMADEVRLEEAFKDERVVRVIDPITSIASSMYEYEHPDAIENESARTEYIDNALRQGTAYGTYVLFPWNRTVVRYPDRDDHRNLRTFRNRNLITAEEQKRLYGSHVASIGLSVGSRATMAMVDMGIGSHYLLADPDTLDPTNLNRIDGSMAEVGSSKVDNIAKRISEKDPWITQTHLPGITTENIGALEMDSLDIIVEAVDSMAVKALLRFEAQRLKVPLIMPADLHDKSMIDVERYDLGDKKNILFAGKLDRQTAQQLASILDSDHPLAPEIARGISERAMLRHTGVTNLTTRMMKSVMRRGHELVGMPQLGTTATMGGAEVAVGVREILLGGGPSSGRYYTDPRKTLKLGAEASRVAWFKTALALKKYATTR